MFKISIFIVCLAFTGTQQQAVVYLSDPTGESGVTGNVTFSKTNETVSITGIVAGLTEGKHGFHIHSLGNIAPGCAATGGHFNPHSVNHGAPEDEVRHVGDLGNIVADATGVAKIDFTDSIIDLEGEHNILGRAVVVHAGEDDLGKGGFDDSLTTGHAGGRVACGVIGLL